jgi:serine protease inhibitor
MNLIKLWLTLFIIALTLTACSDDNEVEYYKIKVDEIEAPETVAVNDTITFRLYGKVGNDGCYSFSHFEDYTQNLAVDLTLWGKHDTTPGACTQAVVFLNGKPYTAIPSQQGIFYIKIHQPDGTTLRDSVIVESNE